MKPSECLKKLLDRKNLKKHMGICANFTDTYRTFLDRVMVAHGISFKDWPLYSGINSYPVPHKQFDARDAYVMLNKWDKRTKYGRNRYKLLVWLIEQFELKGA